MNELPKFKANNPSNKEEELISELIKSLNVTTIDFIKLNFKDNITIKEYLILRDATIGYTASMIRDLTKILAHKNQIKSFLLECQKIFNAYIEEDLKD